jgi:Fe-S cluster biogenesis protein NfuA
MSTDTNGPAESSAATLRTDVVDALDTEFPQLRGGRRVVQHVDADSGVVTLSFSCGCSDGVSDATERAIENTLVTEVDGVTGVSTESGCGCGSATPGDDTGPNAPF